MTPREIALSAISLKKPPRNAATLLSGGLWTIKRRGLTLEELIGKPDTLSQIIIETSDVVESDIVWLGSGYYQLLLRALGAEVKFRKNGVPDIMSSIVGTPSDIDGIDLNRIDADAAMNFLWDAGGLVAKSIGRKYLIGTGMFGPFTVAGQLFGTEKLMRAIYKDPPAAHAVLEFAGEVCFRYIEPFVKRGAEIVSVAEPTSSGDMISRKHYGEFAFPYSRKFVERMHGLGVRTLLHICGDISDRLDLARDTGADVLSVDWKVDLADARDAVKGKAAFAGNLDPVKVMQMASPDEVQNIARKNLAEVGGDGNYIVMPGCDIPHQVPLENIRAMLQAARS